MAKETRLHGQRPTLAGIIARLSRAHEVRLDRRLRKRGIDPTSVKPPETARGPIPNPGETSARETANPSPGRPRRIPRPTITSAPNPWGKPPAGDDAPG